MKGILTILLVGRFKRATNRVINGQSLNLKEGVHIRKALIIPDTLTLSDMLESL